MGNNSDIDEEEKNEEEIIDNTEEEKTEPKVEDKLGIEFEDNVEM